MNYIIIKRLIDLQKIIISTIYLEEETATSQENILENTWAITCSNKLLKKMKLKDLCRFVSHLIQYRSEQISQMDLSTKATFYIWFDALALQLRFNILSGENIELPFGCTLNFVTSYEVILQQYFHAAQNNALYGNYYKILKMSSPDDPEFYDEDEYDDQAFIQDVWQITLPIQEKIKN